MVDWRQFETILLDMDGTLLDLAFDNYFWRELVPHCHARLRKISYEQASADLFQRYAKVQGVSIGIAWITGQPSSVSI